MTFNLEVLACIVTEITPTPDIDPVLYLIGAGPKQTQFVAYTESPCSYTFSYTSELEDGSPLPAWITFD